MKTIFIDWAVRFGCPPRFLDYALIKQYFQANTCQLVDDPKDAELIIAVTCAFEKESEDFSIEKIKSLIKVKKDNARLIITGCLPKINGKRLRKIFRGTTFGPGSLDRLNGILKTKAKVCDTNIITEKAKDKNEPFLLEVCRGCLGRCTYCGIRYSIGETRSRPIEKIVEQFRLGQGQGYKIFLLVGDDVGCYGKDIGSDLAVLIGQLAKYRKESSIGLDTISPDRLIAILPRIKPYLKKRFINFAYLPVQSGSDRILKLMDRGYSAGQFRDSILQLIRCNPEIEIKTDFMVGFPGETENDFKASLNLLMDFCRNVRIVNVYLFDKKEGTRAADFTSQIPGRIKEERKNRMRSLAEFLQSRPQG